MKSLFSGYRLGLSSVVVSFLLACAICFGAAGSGPPAAPGAALLAGKTISPFDLVRETGAPARSSDFEDRVWIAAFTFTRCPSSCPRISTTLKSLQEKLSGTGVRIVSFSVDPKFDTPEVMKSYSEKFGADPERWWFLTGDESEVYDLIQNSFVVSAFPTTPEQRKEGAEEIAHSDRIVLVDRGLKLVRHFDSNDPSSLEQLLTEARRRDLPSSIRNLPEINAILNSTSFVFLMAGWLLVKNRKWRAHGFMMLTCLAISGAFLACYLTYHYFVGTVRFPGTGEVRSLYLSILLSHTVLAVVMVPMIALTVYRAIRKDFDRHRQIARVTFPIWVYISVTGVVIYWMLYRLGNAPQIISMQ